MESRTLCYNLLSTAYDNTLSLSLLQPAKLAEAFKYFVQGMGYSKYWFYGMVHLATKVNWASKHPESLWSQMCHPFPFGYAFARGEKKTNAVSGQRVFRPSDVIK